ncbi:MAG: HNH endonuclease family protein [Marmoricola sp.]
MRTFVRVLALLCALTLPAGMTVALITPAQAAGSPRALNGARISQDLRAAIAHLPGAGARPAGYARTAFRLWDDVDHDCRDTRAEVLAAESEVRATGGCTIRTGRWYSSYDARTYTVAHDLDIDHLVPLEEAWASGARGWSSARREAYANDLGDPRTLVAVSSHENRSKGDRDPAQWLPAHGVCSYVTRWVAVKLRWGLSVDPAERTALAGIAQRCSDRRVSTHRARVVDSTAPSAGSSGGGGTTATHACTRTSSGSCISGGQFCPQASYGVVGYDASGHRYVCSGDRSHPHWQ